MDIPPPPPPFMPGSGQPPAQPQQLIRTYKAGVGGTAEKKFEKDAAKLAQEGWRIQNVNSTPNPFAPTRALTIMVVYVR